MWGDFQNHDGLQEARLGADRESQIRLCMRRVPCTLSSAVSRDLGEGPVGAKALGKEITEHVQGRHRAKGNYRQRLEDVGRAGGCFRVDSLNVASNRVIRHLKSGSTIRAVF